MANRMNFNPAALPIQTLMNNIKNVNKNGLDLRPAYQRGYVWNDDFKEKLIYSIIKSYPIGNVSIRNLESPNSINAKSEVVDGQQRLTTIFNFINDKLEIKGEYARNIIREIKDYLGDESDSKSKKLLKKLERKGNVSIKYSDLPEDVRDNIKAFPLSITYISNASDQQITEYFNFLQNQERLRAGEIINSMPDTILDRYFDDIDNKDKFLNVLSYEDNRMEFDKIFYSIIGLFDGEINFGVTDNVIKDYVSNKKSELTNEALQFTKNMIGVINKISDIDDEKLGKANKRYIKLLLLLAGLKPEYFNIDLKLKLVKLETINNKLSAFNSAKKDMVKNTFYGMSNETIENYRLIALLTKGAHPFSRVVERVDMLEKL